jgi:iron complex outermembrane receptor protein
METIPNVFGAAGHPLGQSPLFQGNMRVRYEFPLGVYRAFTQAGGQYYGASQSTVGTVDNYEMGGYATFDASAGVAKDAWNVSSSRRIWPIGMPAPTRTRRSSS